MQETITDLLNKAEGDIEIIAVLDGYWPDPPLKDDKRLHIVHRARKGMRESINNGVAVAKGEYIMKIDAHCIFSQGYDTTMTADCDGDWVVVPRRYSLHHETWKPRTDKLYVDYEYLGNPYSKKLIRNGRYGMHAWTWDARINERSNILLDEDMTFQGSCWVCKREHFNKRIGKLDATGYGTFGSEAQEVGLTTWLKGGKCMINKRAWYAHLWKGQPYRDRYREMFGQRYSRDSHTDFIRGRDYCVDYWLNNRMEKRVHDFAWLLERFWPVPSWPEDRLQWTTQ